VSRLPLERHWRVALQLVAISVILAAAAWVNIYAADHELARETAQRFGYPGIFLAAVVSGFNLVVPIPVIAFFPFFMETGFQPVLTVVLIALGMTTGDLIGYLLGRAARGLVRPREDGIIRRLEALREAKPRAPLVVMFLYAAFAPLPNELLVLPMAFMRYPLAGIFAAVLAGNLIFNGLIAFGVVQLFEAL
jgi:membrane protein YqaA with SNARE-associated domain